MSSQLFQIEWRHAVNDLERLKEALELLDDTVCTRGQRRVGEDDAPVTGAGETMEGSTPPPSSSQKEEAEKQKEGEGGDNPPAPPSSSSAISDILAIGIEVDVRMDPSLKHAVLRHDPYDADTDEAVTVDGEFDGVGVGGGDEGNVMAAAATAAASAITLRSFFDRLVSSRWFQRREAELAQCVLQNDSVEALQQIAETQLPVIIKLDFKDPRAAEQFLRHTTTTTTGGEWEGFARLMRVLVGQIDLLRCRPQATTLRLQHELLLWWNADVVPSDGTLHQAVTPYVDHPHLVSCRFIDLPREQIMDLLVRTMVSLGVHREVVTLSLGWALDPSAASYSAGDAARMIRFVSDWHEKMAAKDVAAPSAITFPVLWEALFSPLTEQPPERTNEIATQAIASVLQATSALAFHDSRSGAGGGSSNGGGGGGGGEKKEAHVQCFPTFWCFTRDPNIRDEQRSRAQAAFPVCTVDC